LGRAASACRTAEEPLPGGDADPAKVRAALTARGLTELDAERLAHLYGSEADGVAADGGDAAAEARRAVLVEGALTLEDWWVRRSARAWFGEAGGLADLAPAAAAMAPLLGWDGAEQARQAAACRAIHDRNMANIAAEGALA
jgi:glycerol-3-phosphate dehydrogenase